jgi:hypothetical protein
VSRLPFLLAGWAASLDLPAVVVLIFVLLVYLVLGCVIDALAMILLTIPIFYPVVVGVLGLTPSGSASSSSSSLPRRHYAAGRHERLHHQSVVKDLPSETIFKGVWPFVLALFVCILLLIYFGYHHFFAVAHQLIFHVSAGRACGCGHYSCDRLRFLVVLAV